MEEFAVLAGSRHLLQRNIVVLDSIYQPLVLMNTDPRFPFRVSLRNFETAIRAAVVDNDVFPVLISLGQDTVDALTRYFSPL
jgi:hypothetical protein